MPTSGESAAPLGAKGAAAAGSLTIVLPAFNEAGRIEPALDELFGYLDSTPPPSGLPPRVAVLVVDDGSRDATAAIVEARPETRRPADGSAGPTLHLLREPHAGKGSAVRAGMLAADGDLVVFADADMATPPDQLPRLLAALTGAGGGADGAADVAVGSRIQPDGTDMRATQPPFRRFLGRAFHSLASVWVVGPVQDTQCGFKGFTRAAAQDLFGRQRVTSIVFDVELIHLARRRGYRLAIVPIRWQDVRGSRMQPRPGLALQVAWDLFRIPLLHRGVSKRTAARQGAAHQ